MCCAVGDEDYGTFSALFVFSGVLVMAGIEWSAHALQDYAARRKRRSETDHERICSAGDESSQSKVEAGSKYSSTRTTSTTNEAFAAGRETTAEKGASSSAPLLTNEHTRHDHHGHDFGKSKNAALVSLGVWTCVGIALHNVPEGMAVYAALSMDGGDSDVGMSLFYGM